MIERRGSFRPARSCDQQGVAIRLPRAIRAGPRRRVGRTLLPLARPRADAAAIGLSFTWAQHILSPGYQLDRQHPFAEASDEAEGKCPADLCGKLREIKSRNRHG